MTLLRAAAYEYTMHVRRLPLWALPALVVGLTAATGSFTFTATKDTPSVSRLVGAEALSMNLLVLVVVGVLSADRWARDRLLSVEELLDTQPMRPGNRLWAKYFGVTAASVTPLLPIWAVLTIRLAIHIGQWSVVGLAAAAFAAIVLPGLLFVCAFSITLPRVLGVRLYQVLFVGYWFWGNLVPPHLMPTPAGTWLTPVGKFANAALFAGSDHALLLTGGAAPAGGYASMALLTGAALLAVTVFSLIRPSTGRTQQ